MIGSDSIRQATSHLCKNLMLCGTPGDDYIKFSDREFVSMGEGNDTIDAWGVKTLYGGPGRDTFNIMEDAEAIWIVDFNIDEGDKINLSAFANLSFAYIKEIATSWDRGGTDNPTLKVRLPTGGEVMLENVTIDQVESPDFRQALVFHGQAPAFPDLP